MKKHRVIIIGATSSLAGSLLESQLIPQSLSVYGLVRPNTDPYKEEYRKRLSARNDISMLDYDGSDQGMLQVIDSIIATGNPITYRTSVLCLSTHISTHILKSLTTYSNLRTLAIGSGSVIDWIHERKGFDIVDLAQSDETRNFAKYIENKIRVEQIANVTIHPGFYLPAQYSPFTSSGLHIESCKQIFAPEFNPSFNWGKAKFVTPMSDLTYLIISWLTNPLLLNISGGYSFGTTHAYPRWMLREQAGFKDIPESIKKQYPIPNHDYTHDMRKTKIAFGVKCSSLEVTAKTASEWIHQHTPLIET